MGNGEGQTQYTDMQEQFLKHLKKYPVKGPELVMEYVSSQGEGVLENPKMMAKALSECEILPARRRQILKHWFADKGVTVPEDVLETSMTPPDKRDEVDEQKRREEDARKSKYSVDEATGAVRVATGSEKALTLDEAERLSNRIKKELAERKKGTGVTYVYDTDTKQVRMARENEVGGTLEQAKELKRMAEESKGGEGESPFIMDENGHWQLNPKAKVSGIELMALESLRRSQERGEPTDPLDAIAAVSEKVKLYREVFGGGASQPSWLQDPLKFIEVMNTLAGGRKEDEGTSRQIAELQKTLVEMREERYREQIAQQASQLSALANKIDDLTEAIAESKKAATGRTEMDIIHEIATEGIGLAKAELPGLRGDIRNLFQGGRLPPLKSPQQREERKDQYRQALDKDKEVEELGKRLFFGEGG